VSEEKISPTIWNKNCVRGTNLVHPGNKNKDLVDTRNKKIVFEEQISSTQGTRILCLRNKSHLLYRTRIVSEELISSTLGTRIKISSTQGTKKICSRNKSRLPWEQEYCVWVTNLVYYMEQELCPRYKSRQHREQKRTKFV
jgi:hypothetical protein